MRQERDRLIERERRDRERERAEERQVAGSWKESRLSLLQNAMLHEFLEHRSQTRAMRSKGNGAGKDFVRAGTVAVGFMDKFQRSLSGQSQTGSNSSAGDTGETPSVHGVAPGRIKP